MRLRAKLFLPLLLISLIFSAYIHWVWVPEMSTTLKVQALQDRKAHLTSVAEGLIPLLLENQLANIYENLDALLEQNREWQSITLLGSSGGLLYPLEPASPPDPLPAHLLLMRQSVGFIGPNLGTLEVVMDFQPVLSKIEQLETQLGISLILLLIFFVSVIGILLEMLIRRRVEKLSRAAEKLAQGDYTAALPSSSRDEIGSLVQSFVFMRDSMFAYHKQLIGEVDNHRRTAEELESEKNRATYQATHDSLTGLINRREFERLLEEALQESQSDGSRHALLYMDLNQFKIVNDTCGHIAGDALLQQLNIVLQDRMRQHDILARLGGDEFGVLLRHCDLQNAIKVAENLRQTIKEFHFNWDGKTFVVGVSIGVVGMDTQSDDITALLSAADSACYMAKESGRNRVQLYERTDKNIIRQHGEMQWVTQLSEAISKDHFQLFCQPIVSLQKPTSHLFRYEILLRLKSPDGDIIPPGAFIPAAERYNLMGVIDRWVVQQVVRFLEHWSGDKNLQLAVNLSGPSLDDEELLHNLELAFASKQIRGEALCFEITESAAVISLASARHFMERLKMHGCRFALDDFGSGMSSFSYLKTLPVDFLKIDGSFVKDIMLDSVDHAMVNAIHDIGHTMGLETIAEFVENETVLSELTRIGVDYAQGYHIRKPFPLSELDPTTSLAGPYGLFNRDR
jgi:diguanylate cyclase (GGDEF)-like protein